MAKLAAVPSEKASSEERIRQQIYNFADAVRAKDLNKMMSLYAPDIVSFDMMPPLKNEGIEKYRKSWETGLSMMEGPIEMEFRDLRITTSGDLAFCHSLSRMSFKTEGKNVDMSVRWTGCFREINGKWLVTHEHVSVPIDMDTDKAIYDLKP
jgi:ketosteroid isomerase-like protein